MLCSRIFVDLQLAMKSLCKYSFLEGQSRLLHVKSQKVWNNPIENRLNYYLELCEPTMEIIENESDSLLLQILSANFEMKHFFPRALWGFVHVCVLCLSRENKSRVETTWVCLYSPAEPLP